LAWGWGALLVLMPVSARAAEIRWSGVEACRRESEVTEQVEAMTQRRLGEVDVADFSLELSRAEGDAFRLTLVTTPRHGGVPSTRSLQGASCVDITDAAAVAIALTIGTPEEQPANLPLPGPSPLVSVKNEPRSVDSASPASPGPPRPQLRMGLGGTLDSAVSPHAVLGGALRLALAWPGYRLELEGAVYAPAQVLDSEQRGGTFQLLYAAPLGCLSRALGGPQALACVGYEVGRLSATGVGVAEPFERHTFWHAARSELGLLWPLSSDLSISGRIGGALALARHTFVLDDPQAVHRPALLSLRAALGLELRL